MKNYYNKYLEEYEKRMHPENRWMKYMSRKERGLYYGVPIFLMVLTLRAIYALWSMCNLLGEAESKIEWSYLIGFILEVVMICVMGYIVGKISDKYIIRKKNEIAVKVYRLESWSEKNELDKEAFKSYLRNNNVKTEKQISIVLKSIDSKIGEGWKENRAVSFSAIGIALFSPIWSEEVKRRYATEQLGELTFFYLCLLAGLLISMYIMYKIFTKNISCLLYTSDAADD